MHQNLAVYKSLCCEGTPLQNACRGCLYGLCTVGQECCKHHISLHVWRFSLLKYIRVQVRFGLIVEFGLPWWALWVRVNDIGQWHFTVPKIVLLQVSKLRSCILLIRGKF